MTAGILLKSGAGQDGGGGPMGFDWQSGGRRRALGIGLWVFIGVATTLFTLFIASYVMRMDGSDWSPLVLPPQLWLSTALLAMGSVLLQAASRSARKARWARAQRLLRAGGTFALAFLAVQWWAWTAMLSQQISLASNPAASFFYLLTALHGLHVVGGLVGWLMALRAMAGAAGTPIDSTRAAGLIALCARYWHFLLAVWIVLFATLGWLTPEAVRLICGNWT